jgi:hypothetical protein
MGARRPGWNSLHPPLDPKMLPIPDAKLTQGCRGWDELVTVAGLDEKVELLAGPHHYAEIEHDPRHQRAAGDVQRQGQVDILPGCGLNRDDSKWHYPLSVDAALDFGPPASPLSLYAVGAAESSVSRIAKPMGATLSHTMPGN